MYRTHKYNAQRTEVNGIKFPSKKQARRYQELVLMMRAGEIKMFLREVPFHLPGNVKYLADFVVFNHDGTFVVEDVKGVRTQTYIMKKKMVEALYPVKIEEI
jgi:hypothetical protein